MQNSLHKAKVLRCYPCWCELIFFSRNSLTHTHRCTQLLAPAVPVITLICVRLITGCDTRLSESSCVQCAEELVHWRRATSWLIFILTLTWVTVLIRLLLLVWRFCEETKAIQPNQAVWEREASSSAWEGIWVGVTRCSWHVGTQGDFQKTVLRSHFMEEIT